MRYDFTTRLDRRGSGSSKWDMMLAKKPDVSPGVIPLSVADMELPNPPEVVEGLREFLKTAVLGYTSPTGAYFDAVAHWMRTRHGWEVRREWIVPAPGVVPAFFAAVRAFTEPGEGVITMPPVYYPFAMAATACGRTLVANPLAYRDGDGGDGRYHIDFDDLEAKAREPRNKLLLLCSPHNPVGRVWSREELARVADICGRNGVLVVSDEIHFDLLMPGVEHTVYATLSAEAEQNCVVCTAPSKTFNLAGMQASNIVVPNPGLRQRLKDQFMKNAQFTLNILGQKACEIAYTRCAPWLDAFLELLRANHGLVRDFFAAHIPQVKAVPLEGTYLQWLDFRALGLDAAELERFMVGEAEWFTDEGPMFGAEGGGFERINLACPTAALQEALERLRKALRRRSLLPR
ncbi:MAG: pyridoxal phosphate-dependent aminotransferase [Acidobacteriota bacterium]|jgi:putative C-S lyase|nr:pyridoxal phosphate-dependent aminotransferase [Acidobacteriota bacterium]